MKQAEIDFIVKCVTPIVSVIGLIPALYALIVGRKGRLRDEYNSRGNSLKTWLIIPTWTRLRKKKGYRLWPMTVRCGRKRLYLLTFASPLRALSDFVVGRVYLELLNASGGEHIQFRARYRKAWQRIWRKWTYGAGHAIFGAAALSLLVLAAPLGIGAGELIWGLVSTVVAFGPCSVFCLRTAAAINCAEILVRSQREYDPAQDHGRPTELRLVPA